MRKIVSYNDFSLILVHRKVWAHGDSATILGIKMDAVTHSVGLSK